MRGLISFLSGGLNRSTLLFFILPAITVCYFGPLTMAMRRLPGRYDWRSETISKLLEPQRNPETYWVVSAGMALAGALAIPFAGYIGRRLRTAAPRASRAGADIFGGGAAASALSGLIAYHGNDRFPRLHTLLARGAAFALGLGMIVFWTFALIGSFRPSAGKPQHRRALVASWTLLIVGGPAAAVLSVLAIEHRIRESAGLWEWVASAVLVLFLLISALLLPPED